jgi:hypothetical protein
MSHQFAIRKAGTSLLMQQAFRTGKVLGWTSDIYGCRLYLSQKSALHQAALAGFAPPEIEVVTVPLPDRDHASALIAALELIVARDDLPAELRAIGTTALNLGKVVVV